VYEAQTKPLINYYNQWAQRGTENGLAAPRYRRVSSLGKVDEIRARMFGTLE
jgi:adenylate kinase